MNYWIKYYVDNSKYIGEDSAISKGTASWRNSRNSDIIQVDLFHEGFLLRIRGMGEYWQSDVYEALFLGSEKKIIKRRIEKFIAPTDKLFVYRDSSRETIITFGDPHSKGHIISIPKEWVGQWMILEYDVIRKSAQYYVRDGRV